MSLAEAVISGDRLALARLLTKVENDEPEGVLAQESLYKRTGRAHRIGITGAPGTGKSTLVNRIALQLRKQGWAGSSDEPSLNVAIVAVDPSSPFTGGAILGDRIRMRDLSGDPGVYIRSMASRGALGGLARRTADVVDILDAAGFEAILIETVGAGQAEVDIAKTAQTTIVVDAPGLGDDVQAIKAGILEIADIIVVNKADLPGAQATLASLRMALELGSAAASTREHAGRGPGQADSLAGWDPAVQACVATTGEGVAELVELIRAHRQHLRASGEMHSRERARIRAELETLLAEMLVARFHAGQPDSSFEATLERVLARELAPHQALRQLIEGNPS